jgi:hypothetical protein
MNEAIRSFSVEGNSTAQLFLLSATPLKKLASEAIDHACWLHLAGQKELPAHAYRQTACISLPAGHYVLLSNLSSAIR